MLYSAILSTMLRFYHTNHVRKFLLKRPFHRGQKTKDNEYKVHTFTYIGMYVIVCLLSCPAQKLDG